MHRQHGRIAHAHAWVCGRASVCAYHPRDRQGIVFICIYIGVSLRTLPCTLTRRRFPIFRPKLSTEKPRPSNPPAPSRPLPPVHPRSTPPPTLFTSRRSLPFSPRPSRSLRGRLPYATSSRHIRTKSNVSRLNGFVSTVHSHPLSLPPPAAAVRFSRRRRGRNIYYKPRVASGS